MNDIETEVYETFLSYKFFPETGTWIHENGTYKSFFIDKTSLYYHSLIRLFVRIHKPNPIISRGKIEYHFLILYEHNEPRRLHMFANHNHMMRELDKGLAGVGYFPKLLNKLLPPKVPTYRRGQQYV